MSFKGFSTFSFGGHFFSAERKHFNKFGRGSPKDHFCEIILKSSHWPRRKCRLFLFFLFLVLVAILCSGAEPF